VSREEVGRVFGAWAPKTGLSAPTPRAAALRGFRCNPSRSPSNRPAACILNNAFLGAYPSATRIKNKLFGPMSAHTKLGPLDTEEFTAKVNKGLSLNNA
jgi:hypothetical protein